MSVLRIISVAILVLSTSCAKTADTDILQRFEQAESQYREARSPEDFLEVAALYDSILDDIGEDGAVLYNLGNAYFRADEKGRAIAAYRKAKRLRPTDPRLDANLRLALSQTSDRSDRSLWDTILFWRGWIGYQESWWWGTSLVTLVFVLMALGILAPSWRPLTRRVCWGLIPVVSIYLLSLGLTYYEYEMTRNGVVISDRVQARKGNSETYEPAFTEPVREGAEFKVLESQGGWVRVDLGSNLEGWLPESAVVVY